jgi:hypothetical protein
MIGKARPAFDAGREAVFAGDKRGAFARTSRSVKNAMTIQSNLIVL